MKRILSAFLITLSLSTQAGLPPTTLSGQSQTIKPTTFNFKTPYNQSTKISGTESLIETGSENMLINGGFESSTSLLGWTNSGSTDTIMEVGTDSDKVSSGKRALQLTTTAGNSLNLYQSVTTPSGIQKQGVVGLLYKSALSTFQVCSLVDGAEQTCVPSANLILDGLYHSIEIPIVFGTTSAGIKVKSGASSGTQGHYIDAAYVRQGIGYQNLQLDNVYSALITTTSGAVATPNKTGWISCTAANPTVCTFATGIFTQSPNCTVSIDTPPTGDVTVRTTSISSTGLSIYSAAPSTGTARASQPTYLICQKSGNDYLAASAAVYSQSSANYSRRAYTPTLTGFGTSPTSDCYESREGEINVIDCKITVGTTPTAVEARISLPSSNVSQAFGSIRLGSQLIATTSTSAPVRYTMMEPSVSYITIGRYPSTDTTAFTKQLGTSFNSGDVFSFTARVPIAGWSNSSSITGSFAGTPKVPGLDGNVDTFSFSYGTTNATTNCTASPCSYLDQLGSGSVSSVTRSGTGAYALVTTKTYSKLKCVGVTSGSNRTVMQAIYCASCAGTTFGNTAASTGSPEDGAGTYSCIGSY